MKKSKIMKILVVVLSIFIITGCTTTLKDPKTKKVVTYEDEKVKITLNENILCKPTNKGLIKEYNKYKKQIDISKLPDCDKFKPSDANYNNLWETLVVKPLAWLTLKIGSLVKSYGIALIILSIIIRLILAPFTKKTAMQSEKLKEIQPQLTKLEAKYKNRTSEEDQKRKAEEMMMIYQKNKINPFSSCLLSFIQIPLLFAYLEAINRTPVIFENKFLSLDMGTTMSHGLFSSNWYAYLIFLLLILGTSYLSFRKTLKDQTAMQGQMKGTIYFMLAMIAIATFSLPVALGLYWITSSMFTVVQNKLVEGKKAKK